MPVNTFDAQASHDSPDSMLTSPGNPLHWKTLLPPLLMTLVLVGLRTSGYLLFHTLAEFFTVVVGALMFFAAWNTHSYTRNNFLLFLGIGYLWVALLDTGHALVYPGMPFQQDHAVNTTLHLWIDGRLLEAILLLTAPLFITRPLSPRVALGLLSFLGTLLIWSAFAFQWPLLYIEGYGLTPLKVAIEYLVIGLLVVAMTIYHRLRDSLTPLVTRFMIASMTMTIAGELCFTLYVDIYGALNLVGHVFKLFSFWMIYQAIAHAMLRKPFSLMAREAGTYDAIPYPAVLLDRQGRILQANQAAHDVAGQGQRELIGHAVHDLLHPANLPPEECVLCTAIREERQLSGTTLYFPDTDRWHLVSLNPMSDQHSHIGMVQVSTDITDRARAEEALRDSKELLNTVINSTPDWIFLKDREFRYAYANASYAQALNRSVESMLGKTDAELGFDKESIYGNPAKGIRGFRADDTAVLNGASLHNPYDPARAADGTLYIFDTYKHPIVNSRGEIYGVLGYSHDVGERLSMEQELQQAASLFDCTSEGIMVTDADGIITKVNSAFCEITGYRAEQALGRHSREIHSGWQNPEVLTQMQLALQAEDHWQGESWNTRHNGSRYPQWATISTVRNSRGEITGHVCAFSDITPLKQTEQALEHQAQHDALTGLPNRLLLISRLDQAIRQALRSRTTAAMLFLDLDNFKHINDSLGHLVGDQVLRQVAQALRATLREEDTVARQGGDEFMVLLGSIQHPNEAAAIAQKLLAVFSNPIRVDAYELYVGASIGIALCPADGTDTDALIRNADAAMYLAKQAGRQTFRFYTQELNELAARKLAIESGIRHAVQHGDIRVAFQPQADLVTGKLVGAEALARWYSSELGDVSPMEFIPVAESIGLIGVIGGIVLDEAVHQAAVWLHEHNRALRVSVNVSSRQFDNPDLVAQVADCLQRHRLPPQQLQVEITEALLLRHDQTIHTKLEALKALGISIALDDFGTGYSALSYLKHFPIDILKIDQSFVHDIPQDQDDAVLIRTIIAMGHGLGMKVVAEGVETREQQAFLRSEGCNDIQGHLLSPPLPGDKFLALLLDWEGVRDKAGDYQLEMWS